MISTLCLIYVIFLKGAKILTFSPLPSLLVRFMFVLTISLYVYFFRHSYYILNIFEKNILHKYLFYYLSYTNIKFSPKQDIKV